MQLLGQRLSMSATLMGPVTLPSRELVPKPASHSWVGVSTGCPPFEMSAAGTSQDPRVCSIKLALNGGLCSAVSQEQSLPRFSQPSCQVIFFPVLCPADKLCDLPSPRHDAGAAAAETNGVELLRLFLGKWWPSFPPAVALKTTSGHPGGT